MLLMKVGSWNVGGYGGVIFWRGGDDVRLMTVTSELGY